jgi:RNA polymerase sigma-70 factor, ECF subfamily
LRLAAAGRACLPRITVNRAIDWARARRLRGEVAGVDSADHRDDLHPVGPPDAADRGRLSDEVVTALAGLSPEHRAVVVLRYLLEYTPSETSELLGLPRGTVSSRMRRALDRLRPLIESEESE